MHEAFFFGSATQRIFANYHPPAGGAGRVLTVICPPLFSDYMRTYPALRELANGLAEKGQHVLRFDYRGTGDSFGELEQVAVSDWLEDIAHVVREGLEISESSEVRLLGVRAGALLACKSKGASSEVHRLVLWDPVPDGAGYLEILRRAAREMCRHGFRLSRAEREAAVREYAGYTLSDRMVEGLGSLDASAYRSVPVGNLHVVSTSEQAALPVPVASRHLVPFSCDWDTAPPELLVPRPVLERLIECLTRS